MKWLRELVMKILRGAIDQAVQEALDKAVEELNAEIDAQFKGDERAALKSGVNLLRDRAALVIRSKF
jgi:hypothetical protein